MAGATYERSPIRQKPAITIRFEVNAHTSLGESICATGSAKELGFWNPSDSLVLTTTPETYPLWVGEVVIPRPKSRNFLEFKFAKLFGNTLVAWETDGGNRSFQVYPTIEFYTIEEEYGVMTERSVVPDAMRRSDSYNVLVEAGVGNRSSSSREGSPETSPTTSINRTLDRT